MLAVLSGPNDFAIEFSSQPELEGLHHEAVIFDDDGADREGRGLWGIHKTMEIIKSGACLTETRCNWQLPLQEIFTEFEQTGYRGGFVRSQLQCLEEGTDLKELRALRDPQDQKGG